MILTEGSNDTSARSSFEFTEGILWKFIWVIFPTMLDKRVGLITYHIHWQSPIFLVVFSTLQYFSNIHQNIFFLGKTKLVKFQMLTSSHFSNNPLSLTQVGVMSKLHLDFLYVVLEFPGSCIVKLNLGYQGKTEDSIKKV